MLCTDIHNFIVNDNFTQVTTYKTAHYIFDFYKFTRTAMFLVTSPIVINVPTRGLLAVETMHAIVQ